MTSYTIWIPFEYPPKTGLRLDQDIELDIAGYPGVLTKRLRHIGLEITDLPSEKTARLLFHHVSAALLWVIVGTWRMMSIELEPVELQYTDEDPVLYWNPFPDSPFEEEYYPFDASRTAIYPSDKRVLEEGRLFMEAGTSDLPENWLDDLQKALALPSLQQGIVDDSLRLATELYCLSMFETSKRAEFLTLCMALEVLAPNRALPSEISQYVDDLVEQVKSKAKTAQDRDERSALVSLANRVGQLKRVAHAARIRSYIKVTRERDGKSDADEIAKQANRLYRLRGNVVHDAASITGENVIGLKEVVAKTLISAMRQLPSPGE